MFSAAELNKKNIEFEFIKNELSDCPIITIGQNAVRSFEEILELIYQSDAFLLSCIINGYEDSSRSVSKITRWLCAQQIKYKRRLDRRPPSNNLSYYPIYPSIRIEDTSNFTTEYIVEKTGGQYSDVARCYFLLKKNGVLRKRPLDDGGNYWFNS